MTGVQPRQLCFAGLQPEKLHEAFQELSVASAASLTQLKLQVGEHVLREDVPDIITRAAGRQTLEGPELAVLLKCFLLDPLTSPAMAWPEFERSWIALQALTSGAETQKSALARQSAGGLATAAAASRQAAACRCEPLTAQAAIGLHHAAAPLPLRARCEEPGSTYLPLRGTDITRGGEGASIDKYFGMHLSRGL